MRGLFTCIYRKGSVSEIMALKEGAICPHGDLSAVVHFDCSSITEKGAQHVFQLSVY